MPVVEVTQDPDFCTLTMTAQFAAPVNRVWKIYADPRQLEKVWGPVECPATFVDHSLTVGSRCTYFMTDADGTKYRGWWLITAVDEPSSFAFDDGFADEDFNNVAGMPVSKNTYTFSAHEGGTRAVYTCLYESAEALQQVLDMGMVDGATSAINQIDALLAD